MDAIMKRRSIRKFKSQDIPDELVTALLKAAMRAPSAGNEQPWEFIVMKDRAGMAEIINFHPYATMLKDTPCTIVVCGNTSLQKFPYDFWVQDCSAATQNLLIEAVHLGLGAVWLGVYPIDERVAGLKKLLNLPETVIPLCAVALGYPEKEPDPLDTFLPDRIHKETW